MSAFIRRIFHKGLSIISEYFYQPKRANSSPTFAIAQEGEFLAKELN
jgi:hypothetical protein